MFRKSYALDRHSKRFQLYKIAIAAVLSFPMPQAAYSQDQTVQLVGGEFTRLEQGPIAYIRTTEFSCSGILVGEREILTAAHCVANALPNTDYGVIVGGEVFGVESRRYNGSYDPNASISQSGQYDLGILILSNPVTTTQPVPVLFNDFVSPGESLFIYGYGTNELSGLPGRNPLDDAKVGQMIVTDNSGGQLSSVHSLGGASTCSGDSGGPAIQVLSGYSAVVGTLSSGVNKVFSGTCFLAGDGDYSYVDLQSATSQNFLSFFAGVKYISGFRIYINAVSGSLVPSLIKIGKLKSHTSILKQLPKPIRTLKSLLVYADGFRTVTLKLAIRNLENAKKSRSPKDALKLVRKALNNLRTVNGFGVY